MYLFVGSSEPTWLWPDDSNNFFNVQAVGVRWDHGKLWRFESHLQSLGCRACWRHSQNHSSFKFVKVCLNANFKFYFLVEFLHTIWYNCFIARTSIRMRMQRRRWPPIWKSTPPGKDWFKFVERPIGGVLPTKNGLFQCQLVFLSKLDTPIYAIDPDLGSLDGPEPWWLLIALSEADKTGDFSYKIAGTMPVNRTEHHFVLHDASLDRRWVPSKKENLWTSSPSRYGTWCINPHVLTSNSAGATGASPTHQKLGPTQSMEGCPLRPRHEREIYTGRWDRRELVFDSRAWPCDFQTS